MNYHELKKALLDQAAKSTTPILGEFELTGACNYACKMCYLQDHSSKDDLDTNSWKAIFKNAARHGLLYALLTGGEVFLRKDFHILYNYLYDLGVKITLFSNGSTVTKEIIDTLSLRPPELVAITLYGATNETYEEITSIKDGFTKSTKGIDLLLEHNINVSLRTLPLLPIYEELDLLIQFAKKRKLLLNYISYLTPSPYQKRLSPTLLIDFEERIKNAFSLTDPLSISEDRKASNCYALQASYYISSKGDMQMCALAYHPKRSIINKDIKEVFLALRKDLLEINDTNTCRNCDLLEDCPTCYARRLYESKDSCNKYLKEYADLKHE